jgi:Tfp pilus assembly protein PilF
MTAGNPPLSLFHSDAHYNFGLMLMQAHGDVTGAEMMYRRCLTLDPKHTSASYNLANLLYTVKGDFLGAEVMSETILIQVCCTPLSDFTSLVPLDFFF